MRRVGQESVQYPWASAPPSSSRNSRASWPAQSRRGIEAHRIDYNEMPPHGSLNNRTPSEFARGLRERDSGFAAAVEPVAQFEL